MLFYRFWAYLERVLNYAYRGLVMRTDDLKSSTQGRLRDLSKDESGIAAVEFAMVAGPFLFLLFGIISVGFYFFVAFSLEHAVDTASRVIRTGQAQTQAPNPMTSSEFKHLVCSKLPPFMKASAAAPATKSASTFRASPTSMARQHPAPRRRRIDPDGKPTIQPRWRKRCRVGDGLLRMGVHTDPVGHDVLDQSQRTRACKTARR